METEAICQALVGKGNTLALDVKYGIRLKPCCARDAALIVLSQHFKKWALVFRAQRDRRKPRRSLRGKARPAIAGSKLRRTRHGGEFLKMGQVKILDLTFLFP